MSKLWQQNEALAEALIAQGRAGGAPLSVRGSFATRRWSQFVTLARKYRLSYWRSPSYNLTRLLLTLAICIFYGTMFLGRGRLPTDGARARRAFPSRLPAWHIDTLQGRRARSQKAIERTLSAAATHCWSLNMARSLWLFFCSGV